MFQIKTFNAIAPEGLQRLEKEKYATFNAAYFFGSSEEISNPQSS